MIVLFFNLLKLSPPLCLHPGQLCLSTREVSSVANVAEYPITSTVASTLSGTAVSHLRCCTSPTALSSRTPLIRLSPLRCLSSTFPLQLGPFSSPNWSLLGSACFFLANCSPSLFALSEALYTPLLTPLFPDIGCPVVLSATATFLGRSVPNFHRYLPRTKRFSVSRIFPWGSGFPDGCAFPRTQFPARYTCALREVPACFVGCPPNPIACILLPFSFVQLLFDRPLLCWYLPPTRDWESTALTRSCFAVFLSVPTVVGCVASPAAYFFGLVCASPGVPIFRLLFHLVFLHCSTSSGSFPSFPTCGQVQLIRLLLPLLC